MDKTNNSPKEKRDIKKFIIPVVVLTVICLVASLLLALTNSVTKDKIASIDAQNKAKAIKVVFVDCDKTSQEKTDGEFSYSEVFDKSGVSLGFAVSRTVNGYGGKINVMTGIGTDGKIVKVKVLSCDDETPGLGQNTKKDSFADQFIGKSGNLTVVKGDAGDSEISAVTSATISSKAVTKAVNDSLEFFEKKLFSSHKGESTNISQKETTQSSENTEVYSEALPLEITRDNKKIAEKTDENGKKVYEVVVTRQGYGGDVTVQTMFDEKMTVLSVEVLSCDEETPNRGGKIVNDEFVDQFVGKKGPFTTVRGEAGDGEIVAVTSATISSDTVTKCVNDGLEFLEGSLKK